MARFIGSSSDNVLTLNVTCGRISAPFSTGKAMDSKIRASTPATLKLPKVHQVGSERVIVNLVWVGSLIVNVWTVAFDQETIRPIEDFNFEFVNRLAHWSEKYFTGKKVALALACELEESEPPEPVRPLR